MLSDFEPVGSNIQSNILDNNRCTQGLQFSDGDISLASVGQQIKVNYSLSMLKNNVLTMTKYTCAFLK